MFSVHLSEIPRTTSFRTGLKFLGLFGFSFLALFGYIYWQTAVYLKSETDASLHRQIDNRRLQPPLLRKQEVIRHELQDAEGRWPQGLFSAQGEHIAGVIQTMPPYLEYEKADEFRWEKPGGYTRTIRFMAHRFDDGEILIASQDVHDIREFDELLVHALVSGGGLLLVVGLLGSIAMGYSARRRLDTLSSSIKGIIEGDLSGRLPTRGNLDDIDRLANVVNSMLDELERLMSEVKGVCDDIAHDLRTPLTRLIAGLERAQRRNLTQKEYASAIDTAIDDAKGLMQTFRALLRISEIEGSARRSNFTLVGFNKICADAVELFEPLADERGMNLEFKPCDGVDTVMGDSQLLFDAVCNLIDNAIKFSPDGSEVEVTVSADANNCGISIRDHGPGIPEEEREAVFRRLYRSEASR